MTDLPIRAGTTSDWPAITRLWAMAFHARWDEDSGRVVRDVFEPDRSLAVPDPEVPGEVVGHAFAYTRELTVPGAVIPAAHVAGVAVAPTHRRRGLLTRLMRQQLVGLPEPVAVLWASEPEIYPRFGYGLASSRLELAIDTRQVRLPEPAGPSRVRLVPAADLPALLPPVYEAVRPERNGWSSRSEGWWAVRLADPPARREGATELRAVRHEGADGIDGYAVWRSRAGRAGDGPSAELTIHELVAANPTAYLALWRFLLSIDLATRANYRYAGTDEPLLQLANDPRRLGPPRLRDGLYVRIVNLPAALAARRYAAPVDVVLEVTDPLLPGNTGRWQLVGDPDKAVCTRVDGQAGARPADLACDIADLSAVYLGAHSLATLAAAGRVRELRPGTLAPASTGFGWHHAPTPIDTF